MKKILSILLLILITYSESPIYAKKLIFKRDPFNPASEIKIKNQNVYNENSFSVTGIIWDKENPSAVIQFPRFKKIVSIGNKINNYKVTKITKQYIELRTSSNKIMVNLSEEKRFE